jgi:predicted phage-related endonuclease
MILIKDKRIHNYCANPKKMTGRRFPAVLEMDPWTTPFSTYCDITRAVDIPFVDTMFTIAGKAIEPIQINYIKKIYGITVKTPTDVYGPNYFKETRGDFFPGEKIFGGMWDALACDSAGRATAVIECKTTKRTEDWANDIPTYYGLQAALYASLAGLDSVIMVCSFLEDKDYITPEAFVPSVDNTIIRNFKLYEQYPNFDELITYAKTWYSNYVEKGMSPYFDVDKDSELLALLRTTTIDPDATLTSLLEEAEAIIKNNNEIKKTMAATEKRLELIKDTIKERALGDFKDTDTKVVIPGPTLNWSLSKVTSDEVDKKALIADGLKDKYIKEKISYRLSTAIKKEAK